MYVIPKNCVVGCLEVLKSLKGWVYPSSYLLPGAQNLPLRIRRGDLFSTFRLFEKAHKNQWSFIMFLSKNEQRY